MAKKRKPKKPRAFRSLKVWTAGLPGNTCPKRGGKPLKLGDGQCTGCRRFLGVGYFVTIKCAYQ